MIAEAAALALSLGAAGLYAEPVYSPAQRAVSNWRMQAALNIDAPPQTILRFVSFNEPTNLPRCVRLNNYWCIKSARWNGEIASDAEGHVAFSSAHEGAMVAAQLLRRYYVDYGRKSAMAIVSRWAPAECGAAPVVAGRVRTAGVGQKSRATSRANGLATRGIQNTARARCMIGVSGRPNADVKAITPEAMAMMSSASSPPSVTRAPESNRRHRAIGRSKPRSSSGTPASHPWLARILNPWSLFMRPTSAPASVTPIFAQSWSKVPQLP